MQESDTAYLVRRIRPTETLDQLVSFPRYFEIETVNACNAACPMCTIADWQRKDGVMKDDLFEKIAGEIEKSGVNVRVHLYRDGEPLLDKKLAKRIARIRAGGNVDAGISTNAALLTPERAEAILAAGIDEVILSVDSLKKEVYEKIRVGLDFRDVLVNSLVLFRVRDRLESNCKIRVRMIRQESNKDEWDSGAFEAMWLPHIRHGHDSIEHRNLHNWGGQLAGYKPVSIDDTSRPCLALWSLMTIFADGSVPLCNVDYNNRFPLGNVRDTSIADLWRSQEQNRRRHLHMSGERKQIPPCADCTVWSERTPIAA